MKKIILIFLAVLFWQMGFAYIYEPENKKKRSKQTTSQISLRENCDQPTDKFFQSINNVRAILTTGGDTWTENSVGKYIVPRRENTEDEVSSLYSGAVWIGGRDPGGNIKFMAGGHRSSSEFDIFAGPLDEEGSTEKEICDRWDIHFKVLGAEIDRHIINYEKAEKEGIPMDCDSIPDGVKYWPAKGNPYFFSEYKFKLPRAADLAPFFDADEDDLYDPCNGDFPIINIEAPEGRGSCPPGVYADEMYFWVYNDAGGPHTKTHGLKIQMEVQVEAFAWTTNDEINDMTFQRYKLINKANSDIKDCYFAWWVDPDLGCAYDDYIGCVPPPVNLMYVYNVDEQDGSDGCSCTQGTNTYCDKIPLIGVDYFRGPLAHFKFRIDSIFVVDTVTGNTEFERIDTALLPIAVDETGDTTLELGMTSFTYYVNPGSGSVETGMTDPSSVIEYYNYLTGYWKDGTPITKGGNGYDISSSDTVKYVFPDAPNNTDVDAWSMYKEDLPLWDVRTVQATGPFVLKPGDVNELIIGVPWVPSQTHPGPALDELLVADELAQALFDNCFELQDGPDAPDVDIVELNRQLILVLSNDTTTSNNPFEQFSEIGIKIDKAQTDDNIYYFEGYQVYQLINGDVSGQELDNFEKARLIFQSDIKNGIGTLYNWKSIDNPSVNGASEKIFIPTKKVTGADKGLRHVINVVEDQFAQEGRALINHKPYYFMALAYETNNWQEFSPSTGVGQREPFFPGRRNVKIYKAVPRPIAYAKLNIDALEGPEITRIEGIGIGSNFATITKESEEEILNSNFLKDVTYNNGFGPFEVKVFSPFEIKDKEYKLEFFDKNMGDDELDITAYWLLTDLETGNTFRSDTSINEVNEQVIYGEGFSVTIGQVAPFLNLVDEDNGVIGSKLIYSDPEAVDWMQIIGDDSGVTLTAFAQQGPVTWDVTNFMKTGSNEVYEKYDPNRALNKKLNEAPFVPFMLTEYAPNVTQFYVSPAPRDYMSKLKNGCFIGGNCLEERMNNVDIVFTSDKSKWSRCVVVEESYTDLLKLEDFIIPYVIDGTYFPEGDAEQFQLRAAPSVGKEDNDGDGLADGDGDGDGMGWFPGYAIDIETGERLNIFFGEASIYGGGESMDTLFRNGKATGRDMMFNPTNDAFIQFPGEDLIPGLFAWNLAFGGMHMVYVTDTRYDECAEYRESFKAAADKTAFYKQAKSSFKTITWAGIIMATVDTNSVMLPYSEGLIPNDTRVQLRVNSPYRVPSEDEEFLKVDRNGYGSYLFDFRGNAPGTWDELEKENPLDEVNVVPNPYYAYSEYETSQFNKQVKITNLPGNCTVTIYSIDGKFIKKFNRDERGIDYRVDRSNPAVNHGQIYPDLVWDIKNHKGIPVASGVYLIHVVSEDLKAERTIKWFGINREFDPTGL